MPEADEPPEEDSDDDLESEEEEAGDEEGEDEAGEGEEEGEADLAGAFVEEAGTEERPSSSSREMEPSSLKEDSQAGETSRARAKSAAAEWAGRMRGIGMSGVPFGVGW